MVTLDGMPALGLMGVLALWAILGCLSDGQTSRGGIGALALWVGCMTTYKEPLVEKSYAVCSKCLAADSRCLTVMYPDRTVVVVHCEFCGHQELITGPTVPGPHN